MVAADYQPTAAITEWTVPTPKSGPLALTLDQSGTCCWFLEYFGDKIGHLDPSSGVFQEWPIPTIRANPSGLTITSMAGRQIFWGTESGADKIFLFLPTSGMFREYSLPHYTTGVGDISAEPSTQQIRVWFVETILNNNGEFIYDSTTGNVTLYEDTFPAAVGGGAAAVYAGSSAVWFAGLSGLVRWDRATQQYTVWPLPVHGLAVGRSVTLDRYGQVWYSQGVADGNSEDNFVGVLRQNSTFQEWRVPTVGADARGISIDPLTQEPWITEQSSGAGNGTVSALDSSNGGVFVPTVPVTYPSGGTPIVIGPAQTQVPATKTSVAPVTTTIVAAVNAQFTDYKVGPTLPNGAVVDSSGNIWVSEPQSNKIARITRGKDFALVPSTPTITLPQGGSATVQVAGASISGYVGQVTIQAHATPNGTSVAPPEPNLINVGSRNNSSSITVNVASKTPTGRGTLVVQGSDGTIAHETSIIVLVTNSTASPSGSPLCLIATATYGSELAPEVQLLRNFRDNSIMKTQAGSNFMIAFNAWYYSFSPYVATYISSHWAVRTVMKGVLYPLVGMLYLTSRLFSATSAVPELAALFSGLLASSLIGAFYLGLPLGLILGKSRRLRNLAKLQRYLSMALLSGLGGLLLGEVLASPLSLTISSCVIVLSTFFLAALATSGRIARRFHSSSVALNQS